MAKIAGAFLLLALVLAAGIADAARMRTRAELERIEAKELEQLGAPAETWQLPGGATYKNIKPLIGIMTQPCHDCPGVQNL